MECFVIIVDDFHPLTIITKCSILDVPAELDLPVKTCYKTADRKSISPHIHVMTSLFMGKQKLNTMRGSFDGILHVYTHTHIRAQSHTHPHTHSKRTNCFMNLAGIRLQ